ncbi:MAG: hypothetical protein AB8B55_01905 [Mariniblastus sp.]
MIRTFALTFCVAVVSIAFISQSAVAQVYQSNGYYCQRPIPVVRTCAMAQPAQYYQPAVAQQVSMFYPAGSPASPVVTNPVAVSSSVVAPQTVYPNVFDNNNVQSNYPTGYVDAVPTSLISTTSNDGAALSTTSSVAPLETVPFEASQATYEETVRTAPVQSQPAQGIVQPGNSKIDLTATPPVDDSPKPSATLKVESSTDAPTPASEKSILSK